MTAPKNTAPKATEAAKPEALAVHTNFEVVDNTHEPSDTKPRTARKAVKEKVGGFEVVHYE